VGKSEYYSTAIHGDKNFQWFPPSPPVSSTNKTDHHDIAEILLKVALNTIKQTAMKRKYTGQMKLHVVHICYGILV
jgi:hypothetical protein